GGGGSALTFGKFIDSEHIDQSSDKSKKRQADRFDPSEAGSQRNEHHKDHGKKCASAADTDQSRFHQRISEHSLKRGTGDAESSAHQDCHQYSGHPNLEQDIRLLHFESTHF